MSKRDRESDLSWSDFPGITTLELQFETRKKLKDCSTVSLLPEGLIDITQELLCPICLDIMENVMVTRCLHRFCKDCISKHLRQLDQKRECPSCRIHLVTNRSLRKDDTVDAIINLLFPNRDKRRNDEDDYTQPERSVVRDGARRHRELVLLMQQQQKIRRQNLLIEAEAAEAAESYLDTAVGDKDSIIISTAPEAADNQTKSSASTSASIFSPYNTYSAQDISRTEYSEAMDIADGKADRYVWAEMKSSDDFRMCDNTDSENVVEMTAVDSSEDVREESTVGGSNRISDRGSEERSRGLEVYWHQQGESSSRSLIVGRSPSTGISSGGGGDGNGDAAINSDAAADDGGGGGDEGAITHSVSCVSSGNGDGGDDSDGAAVSGVCAVSNSSEGIEKINDGSGSNSGGNMDDNAVEISTRNSAIHSHGDSLSDSVTGSINNGENEVHCTVAKNDADGNCYRGKNGNDMSYNNGKEIDENNRKEMINNNGNGMHHNNGDGSSLYDTIIESTELPPNVHQLSNIPDISDIVDSAKFADDNATTDEICHTERNGNDVLLVDNFRNEEILQIGEIESLSVNIVVMSNEEDILRDDRGDVRAEKEEVEEEEKEEEKEEESGKEELEQRGNAEERGNEENNKEEEEERGNEEKKDKENEENVKDTVDNESLENGEIITGKTTNSVISVISVAAFIENGENDIVGETVNEILIKIGDENKAEMAVVDSAQVSVSVPVFVCEVTSVQDMTVTATDADGGIENTDMVTSTGIGEKDGIGAYDVIEEDRDLAERNNEDNGNEENNDHSVNNENNENKDDNEKYESEIIEDEIFISNDVDNDDDNNDNGNCNNNNNNNDNDNDDSNGISVIEIQNDSTSEEMGNSYRISEKKGNGKEQEEEGGKERRKERQEGGHGVEKEGKKEEEDLIVAVSSNNKHPNNTNTIANTPHMHMDFLHRLFLPDKNKDGTCKPCVPGKFIFHLKKYSNETFFPILDNNDLATFKNEKSATVKDVKDFLSKEFFLLDSASSSSSNAKRIAKRKCLFSTEFIELTIYIEPPNGLKKNQKPLMFKLSDNLTTIWQIQNILKEKKSEVFIEYKSLI
jgi:hypothetical protein